MNCDRIAEQARAVLAELMGCRPGETMPQSVRSEAIIARALTEATATAEAERDKAQDGLANIQRHRDQWRGYAYGKYPKPDDFLDGNMVDRPPTALEVAVIDNERLRTAERRVYADPDLTFGCDAAEHLADLILDLRAQLTEARRQVWEEAAEALDGVAMTGDAKSACEIMAERFRQRAQSSPQTETTK